MGHKEYSARKRGWKQISEKERYQLEILLREGLTAKEASRRLGRDRRTIEREIARGTVKQLDSELREKMVYCADTGQRISKGNGSNKGRGLKIGHDHKLAQYIEEKIGKEKYSPDAVIGEIKANGLKFDTSICTKTVYNYLDKGIFLGISNKDLPVKRNRKKHKHHKIRSVALNNLKGRSIEERPEEIELRKELGHWEMDCVVGQGKACLLVLTERKSRKELIYKLRAKKQSEVIAVIDRLERAYKKGFKGMFKSITMDNGCEFLDCKKLEASCLKTGEQRTTCYYAHPYSAWERGSNEVNNKLIRRFVPKGANIGSYTKADIRRIEHWMNNYPRRMFDYKSANEIFAA